MSTQIEKLSTVINTVATHQFYANLLAYLEVFFTFDNAIIYAFEYGYPPHCLLKTKQENHCAVRLYQQGAYLEDPFYQALHRGRDTEMVTLHQLAPEGFYQTDYYRHFYHKTGWHDEIGLLLQLTSKLSIGIFLGSVQRTKVLYSSSLIELDSALTLAKSMIRLHANVIPANQSLTNNAHPLYAALTPREQQIVELILKGNSSQRIAMQLFISLGTVKNHRKSIYSKLDIHSQAELFSLFLSLPQSHSA